MLSNPAKWRALTVLAAAQFMVVLDATIVNVALPAIRSDLGFSTTSLEWVINAYTLTLGGLLLLGGRLADLIGRRRIFALGLVVFTLASVAAGLATNETLLIGARGLQGMGAALLSPAALSLVMALFEPGKERNTALGIWGALAGLGGTLGVVFGGYLVTSFGWSSVFFVNVPVGLAALVATFAFVPSVPRTLLRRPDVLGALLGTSGTLLLVYAITQAGTLSWTSTSVVAEFAAAVLLLVAFVAVERARTEPLVPLGLFRSRSLRAANTGQLFVGATFAAMFFLGTLELQGLLGYSALKTGFAFLPMGIVAIVASAAASSLVTRVGARKVLIVGGLTAAVGLYLLSHVHPGANYLNDVLPGLIIYGIGLPLCFVPNTILSQHDVGGDDAGIASGLINATSQIGSSIGLAVVVTLATEAGTRALEAGQSVAQATASGYHTGYLATAGFALAATGVASLFEPKGGALAPTLAADTKVLVHVG